jgi:hypothetical protein
MLDLSRALTLVCEHVFRHERPVLFFAFFRDGTFQCDCNGKEHSGENEYDGFKPVCFGHVLDYEPTLTDLGKVDRGFGFKRKSVDDPWTKFELPEDSN